ncbi:hypothetical protein H5410_060409 [Solanum commersonii]|uniref:Uncharacterized protein n=1 Tax=Solanum commersonii TaxID=4109 RepID=A0A9J5W501_SOLCO|nr:hypothetical protein H5410_060409 [Solanum commersonii]
MQDVMPWRDWNFGTRLRKLLKGNLLPLVVGEDFIVIFNKEEKIGDLEFTQSEVTDFANCISRCALSELKILGKVQYLIRQGFDHAPLHMACILEEDPTINPFRFLNFWAKHPQFKE